MRTAEMPPIEMPDLDYLGLSPLLIVAGVALTGVLIEAFCPRRPRFVLQAALAGLGTIAALVMSVVVYDGLDVVRGAMEAGRGSGTGDGSIMIDGPGVLTWMMLAVFGLRMAGFACSVMAVRSGYAVLAQYLLVFGACAVSAWIILRSVVIEPPARLMEFFDTLATRFTRRTAAS